MGQLHNAFEFRQLRPFNTDFALPESLSLF